MKIIISCISEKRHKQKNRIQTQMTEHIHVVTTFKQPC